MFRKTTGGVREAYDMGKMLANVKTRQTAMKRYFKYAVDESQAYSLLYPYKGYETDLVSGTKEKFNLFCDGYSLVLTREDLGGMEIYQDHAEKEYPLQMLQNILDCREKKHAADIHGFLENARNIGYTYKGSECRKSANFTYVWKYGGTYGKVGILDQAFKIIDDGFPAWISNEGPNKPLILETSIGVCAVLPVVYMFPSDSHKILEILAT